VVTPNFITYFRLLLTLLGIYMLFALDGLGYRVLAFGVLTLSALGDIADGWLARKTGLITSTGIILDPIVDKVLILGVMSAFSFLGLYSVIWVVLIALREIVVTVIRLIALKTGRVLAAETLGKAKTISQMVSLGVSYLYLFCRDHLSRIGSWPHTVTDIFWFGNYAFLIIAFILTFWSGWSFFISLSRNK